MFLLLLSVITLAAYSQKTELTTVNSVKPKAGQKMAFEAAYKVHVSKFHKDDNKTSVYEILSGPYAGYYQLVNSGRAYADFDKERPDAAAHSLDLDKTFFPLLEDTKNATYRFVDSLSFRTDVQADKFLVTIRHIKPSLEGDYRQELSRGVKALKNTTGKFFENYSFNTFEQLWDGTDPIVVSVRKLKDGFQSLDGDFYGPAGSNFQDEYVKLYGTAAWDKRNKLNEEALWKTEQHIMKFRKDLSSQ